MAAIVATMRVLVIRPDKARAALVKSLEGLGGYPSFLGEDRLTLKVAPENVGELLRRSGAREVHSSVGGDDAITGAAVRSLVAAIERA